jgi:RES domain-containing protein
MATEARPRQSTLEQLLGELPSEGRPFSGTAVCIGPPRGGLAVGSLVTTAENRWSASGEPTVYLASDGGVALAELARHLEQSPPPAALWSIEVAFSSLLDLRAVCASPDVERGMWLDAPTCRALAGCVRGRWSVEGIIVPSVAFLDDPTRSTLVIFTERSSRPLEERIRPRHRLLTVMTDESHQR